MNRAATCASSAINEIDTTVSRSTAATRSTTVWPRIRRSTPNAAPKKISTAETTRMPSAKGFLQVLLERAGDDARYFVGIGRLHIEPVNKQAILVDVDHQRARRQRDRVRECESPHRRFQPGLDLHDARIDVDARRVHVTHHVDVGAHELDRKDAGEPDEVIKPRGGEPDVPPRVGIADKQVGQHRRNQRAGHERLGCEGRVCGEPDESQENPEPNESARCPRSVIIRCHLSATPRYKAAPDDTNAISRQAENQPRKRATLTYKKRPRCCSVMRIAPLSPQTEKNANRANIETKELAVARTYEFSYNAKAYSDCTLRT